MEHSALSSLRVSPGPLQINPSLVGLLGRV
jgi:hypothetical protein